MSWISQRLEPTPGHFIYFLVSLFLIFYCLFSNFIRNRLHLSEPPLALLFGIICGPKVAGVLNPYDWGFQDNITQEAARVIVGLQVFSVGVELPKMYFTRHWKSVAMLLGPVMTFSWLITAGFVCAIMRTDFKTAMIVSACLAPTDPVLAAAVLAESKFSIRVPKRLKDMLSAESGCNDGVSFPFLYIGLYSIIYSPASDVLKEFVLSTILWQCTLSIIIGLTIGYAMNHALRWVERTNAIDGVGFLAFYFLLAIFSVGVSSLLGIDDFLVAFGSGYALSWDGWFRHKLRQTRSPALIDLIFNASMFVYVGATIPWDSFSPKTYTPNITPGRLVGLLVLILLFRRIPIVLLLKRFIPDIRTYREALFCGHFGPMGLGAVFLVIEARAQLETSTSLPFPHPPKHSPNKDIVEQIYPIVLFIVMGSTVVHGLSVAAISIYSHYSRMKGERAPLLAQEQEGLHGFDHDGSDSEPDVSGLDTDDGL